VGARARCKLAALQKGPVKASPRRARDEARLGTRRAGGYSRSRTVRGCLADAHKGCRHWVGVKGGMHTGCRGDTRCRGKRGGWWNHQGEDASWGHRHTQGFIAGAKLCRGQPEGCPARCVGFLLGGKGEGMPAATQKAHKGESDETGQ
jgi:hypothetical protein